MLNTTEIVQAIKDDKSEKALQQIYRDSLPSIVRFIKEKRGSRSDAEDCFQEALLVLIKKIKLNKYNDTYEVKNFLFVIARNIWFNKLKRKGMFSDDEIQQMNVADDSIPLDEKVIASEREQGIKQLLSLAGEKCRELLHLVLFENKKLKEVQEIMGFKSEGVVKTTHFRCKDKLKTELSNNPELYSLLRS